MDELELDFDSGLTVLTGETGAGKSILLEALSLATGKRAETNYVKNSTKKATVTAIFEINKNKHAKQMLHESGLDEEICILRRILDKDGKSKAFCNDEPVTLSFLKKSLFAYLIFTHNIKVNPYSNLIHNESILMTQLATRL